MNFEETNNFRPITPDVGFNANFNANGPDNPTQRYDQDFQPVSSMRVEANSSETDDDDDDDDDELEEIVNEDFPRYFSERDGRLFHSHGSSPYMLPVDTPEQERLTAQHYIFRHLYSGPVRSILGHTPAANYGNRDDQGAEVRPKQVLDVCTGNGKWLEEMAREFPHVEFLGVDIVPIATQYPPNNATFMAGHDVNERWCWRDGRFDLIHARNISMVITDYRRLLEQVSRTLQSGGLFIGLERIRHAAFDPAHPAHSSLDPAVQLRNTTNFFGAINGALHAIGIDPDVPENLHNLVYASGAFRSIYYVVVRVPIGAWHPDERMRRLGKIYRESLRRYAESVRFLLRDKWGGEREVRELLDRFVGEIYTVDGMCSEFLMVCAVRA